MSMGNGRDGGGGCEATDKLLWMKTVSFRNTKHICFGRKSLRSAHAQALEEVYGWGGLSIYPDNCLKTAVKWCVASVSRADCKADIEAGPHADEKDKKEEDTHEDASGEVLSTVRLNLTLELGGIVSLHGTSDEAADIMFKLLVGMHVTQPDDLESFYAPPYLKYTYCPEDPVLFEGSLLKNLLIGAAPQQPPGDPGHGADRSHKQK